MSKTRSGEVQAQSFRNHRHGTLPINQCMIINQENSLEPQYVEFLFEFDYAGKIESLATGQLNLQSRSLPRGLG